MLGGGLIITSQIEDNERFSPILLIHWQINDSWRVSSRTTGNILTRSGVELVYGPSKEFEVAFGVAAYFSRFRLDDEGVAPDGVGQDEATPIWLRATWKLNDNLRLEGVGGMAIGGNIRLENEDGHKLADEQYDAAPFAGFFLNIAF